MDSIVSTFFSLICNSKSLHKKMVQDFMSLAIINCTQSLFSCVIPPADGTKDDMHCKDIIRKFEQIHTAFKAMMDSILPSTPTTSEGLGLKLQTVESADAIKSIRNGLFDRILKSKDNKIVLLSPPSADSPKPKVFTEIERYLNQQFESLLGSSKAILAPKEIRHSGSVIKAHGNNDDKMKVLKAISETVKIEHSFYAKKIVYLRIYMDSLCYGMFHYASYDDTCHPEKDYFKTMSNPLSQSFGNSTVSSVVTPNKGTRVTPHAHNTLLTAEIPDIAAAMTLRANFTPSASTPIRPKSARGPKKPKQKKTDKKKENKAALPKGARGQKQTQKPKPKGKK